LTSLRCIIPILLMAVSFAFLRARRSQMRREKMLGKLSDSPAAPTEGSPSLDLLRRLRLPNYASLPRTGKVCVIVAVGLTIFILTRNPILALLPWPGFTLGHRGLQRYRTRKAGGRKEEQILEFIDSLIQSLRSGLSLQQSLEHAADDLGKEMRADITTILNRVRMGAGLEETLSRAGESISIPSLRLTFIVLGLLHGKGGDLPRILERLRKRVSEGIEVRREARILTSQSRASGYLVSALPGVFLLVQTALNPRSLQPLLATPTGNVIILVALLLNATALVFIRKIVGQGG
jgi:Flp pilus assembly protein TadB